MRLAYSARQVANRSESALGSDEWGQRAWLQTGRSVTRIRVAACPQPDRRVRAGKGLTADEPARAAGAAAGVALEQR
jgi:hypothetical protein